MMTLSEIDVRAGRRFLLSGISLSLVPGRLLAILGPNGAGKSTLLSVLAGERRPDAGLALLDGIPLDRWTAAALAKRRAVMHQSSLLSFPFTVEEVVALGLGRLAAARRGDVMEHCLAVAGILHLRGHAYTRLSGGERQRVHFARALAQLQPSKRDRPGLLLLDEPTASLDPGHQHQLLAATKKWCQDSGGMVAMVLHDLTLAAAYCDEAILLADGRLLWQGAPDAMPMATLHRVFGVPFHRFEFHPSKKCAYVTSGHAPGVASDLGIHDNNNHYHDFSPHPLPRAPVGAQPTERGSPCES